MEFQVQHNGGITNVLENDSVLEDLTKFDDGLSQLRHHKDPRGPFSVNELKDELRIGIEGSLMRNMEVFDLKFGLRQRQLNDELGRLFREGNNRIVDAVKEGPHDRIENNVGCLGTVPVFTGTNLFLSPDYQRTLEGYGLS